MKAKKAKELVAELIGEILNEPQEKSTPSAPEVVQTAEVSAKDDDSTSRLPTPLMPDSVAESGAESLPIESVPDETMRLGESKIIPKFAKQAAPRGKNVAAISNESNLSQSENLRVAQNHIFELEHEIERLRRENEQLAAAGETIRKRTNELIADNDMKTRKVGELQERLASEKEILEASLKAKDRELKEIKMRIEEYEMRLSTNLQKIRVRERELENRLELVKMESTAIVRSKDEIILDLKRQIDQINAELENYRNKGQELHKQINEKQETLRRTVKALRLALTMLEGGGDDNVEPLKKAK